MSEWKLVPVEPTGEQWSRMKSAVRTMLHKCAEAKGDEYDALLDCFGREVYDAALAAAPAAPAQEPVDERAVIERVFAAVWPSVCGDNETEDHITRSRLIAIKNRLLYAPAPAVAQGDERDEKLKYLRAKLKSGEYDGADIMAAWIAIDELLRARAALAGRRNG